MIKRYYGVGEPMYPQSVASAYWPFQKPFFPAVRIVDYSTCLVVVAPVAAAVATIGIAAVVAVEAFVANS